MSPIIQRALAGVILAVFVVLIIRVVAVQPAATESLVPTIRPAKTPAPAPSSEYELDRAQAEEGELLKASIARATVYGGYATLTPLLIAILTSTAVSLAAYGYAKKKLA